MIIIHAVIDSAFSLHYHLCVNFLIWGFRFHVLFKMQFFSNYSPFDPDVEKATSELNTTENTEFYKEICNHVLVTPNGPKDCLKSIIKRIHSKNPVVAMQAVNLLDACIQSCGHDFRKEISSDEFVLECRNWVNGGKMHSKVIERLKFLIQRWAENEFRADPSLSHIPHLYNNLKSDGHMFPADNVPKESLMFVLTREESDLARAIALSLRDGRSKLIYNPANKNSSNSHMQEPRKVKALYDFESVEDNELTFAAGEIIGVLDDSDPNWWKGMSWRGEGLFPANFVTSDLNANPEPEVVKPKKSVHFQEEVEVKIVESAPVFEIDEDKINEALSLIQDADPAEDSDSSYLILLEEQCKAMTPLIDQELEKIDKQHLMLSGFNEKLLEAFKMYHNLMSGQLQFSYVPCYSEQPSLPLNVTSSLSVFNPRQSTPGSQVLCHPSEQPNQLMEDCFYPQNRSHEHSSHTQNSNIL